MIGRFRLKDKIFFGTLDAACVRRDGKIYDLADLAVLAPTCPSKIVCVGLNYGEHAQELGVPIPKKPIIFLKPSTSVIGPNANIVCPAISSRVDYEGELALVISKKCKNVADSASVILGYTCFYDVTARDIQNEDGQWTRAKSFDTFAPGGPFIATDLDPGNVDIITRVNGHQPQRSNTENLIFNVDYLVKFMSAL